EAGSPADCGPEGECSDDQQERGQEDRHQGEAGAGDAVGPRSHDGAQVGGEGEERTWHSLGGAVAGYELLVGHPAGRDDLCLEQRKDDVASAKDQRPGAEKAIEDRKRLGPRELASDRQREQETEEQHEHGRAQAPPDGDRRSRGRRRDSARQESQPDQRRGGDDDDLRGSRRPDERADRRQERDRGTPAVGSERPRHAPDGERDHGHRGHLQSMQPTGIGDLEHPEAIGECDQRNGRSEEHTSELQSPCNLVCRLLLEKKNGYDVDGTDQTSLGQFSGRVQQTYKHSGPRFFVPEHGTMFTLALVRFPPTATKEIQYLNAKGALTYTDIAGDPVFFFNLPPRPPCITLFPYTTLFR